MTQNYAQLADDAKRLARQYQGVIAIGEWLEKQGQLDGLRTELEGQVGRLQVAVSDQEALLLSARRATEDERAAAAELRAEAEREIGELIAAAKADAEAGRQAAITVAKSIEDAARGSAAELAANAAKGADAARAQIASLQSEIAALQGRKEALAAEVAAAEARMSELKALAASLAA